MRSRLFSLGLSLLLFACGHDCPSGTTDRGISGGGHYCDCPAGTTAKFTGGVQSCVNPNAPPPPPPTGTLPANCHFYNAQVSTAFAYCTGAYPVGQAVSLCPSGWRVCTVADVLPAELQTACTDPNLGGFMVADVPSYHDPANPAQGACSQAAGFTPGLSGCGLEKAAATFAAPVCAGWPKSVICSQSTNMSCPGGNIATAVNVSSANGASCCH